MRTDRRDLLVVCCWLFTLLKSLIIMSRIGKLPVALPEWVSATLKSDRITITWPKGELTEKFVPWVFVKETDEGIVVSIKKEENKAFWGLMRALIQNMVVWVTEWYEKKLQVIWVWYSAKISWRKLTLNLGFSHPVEHELPEVVEGAVEKDPKGNDLIVLKSIHKQLVWQHAAKIKAYRPPEVYKWKWVRYLGEQVTLKPGKAAAAKE